jgi:hypothetical protein
MVNKIFMGLLKKAKKFMGAQKMIGVTWLVQCYINGQEV